MPTSSFSEYLSNTLKYTSYGSTINNTLDERYKFVLKQYTSGSTATISNYTKYDNIAYSRNHSKYIRFDDHITSLILGSELSIKSFRIGNTFFVLDEHGNQCVVTLRHNHQLLMNHEVSTLTTQVILICDNLNTAFKFSSFQQLVNTNVRSAENKIYDAAISDYLDLAVDSINEQETTPDWLAIRGGI